VDEAYTLFDSYGRYDFGKIARFPKNQNRLDVVKRCDTLKKAFWNMVLNKLVFLDESGVKFAILSYYSLSKKHENIPEIWTVSLLHNIFTLRIEVELLQFS